MSLSKMKKSYHKIHQHHTMLQIVFVARNYDNMKNVDGMTNMDAFTFIS